MITRYFLSGSRNGHVAVTCNHEIIVLFSFLFRDNHPHHGAYKMTHMCNFFSDTSYRQVYFSYFCMEDIVVEGSKS